MAWDKLISFCFLARDTKSLQKHSENTSSERCFSFSPLALWELSLSKEEPEPWQLAQWWRSPWCSYSISSTHIRPSTIECNSSHRSLACVGTGMPHTDTGDPLIKQSLPEVKFLLKRKDFVSINHCRSLSKWCLFDFFWYMLLPNSSVAS